MVKRKFSLRLFIKLSSLTLWLLTLGFPQPTLAGPFSRVAFYFAAHADDWQLFMGSSAYKDAQDPATKVVVVHLTAGDDGLGQGTKGRASPYFIARETGALTAIRFMQDVRTAPTEMVSGKTLIQSRPIMNYSYKNVRAWFLRLPDGNLGGQGFSGTDYASLKRFYSGQVGSLTTVSGDTTYDGWSDLTATLRSLIRYESGNLTEVTLHFPELDESLNPGDHSDHLYAAQAVTDAIVGLNCLHRVQYVDYASSQRAKNLSDVDHENKTALFAATISGVISSGHESTWEPWHRSWLSRNYFRRLSGTGNCQFFDPRPGKLLPRSK